MKKIVAAALLVWASYGHAEGVTFEKDNGSVELARADDGVSFLINSTVGPYSCEAKGMAKVVNESRVTYTSPTGFDGEDKCQITIDFIDVNHVKVTTDSCRYYCGLQAVDSMDGDYQKSH